MEVKFARSKSSFSGGQNLTCQKQSQVEIIVSRVKNSLRREAKVSGVKSSFRQRTKSQVSNAVLGRGQSFRCQKQVQWDVKVSRVKGSLGLRSNSHVSKAVSHVPKAASTVKSKSQMLKRRSSESHVSKAVSGGGRSLRCQKQF